MAPRFIKHEPTKTDQNPPGTNKSQPGTHQELSRNQQKSLKNLPGNKLLIAPIHSRM